MAETLAMPAKITNQLIEGSGILIRTFSGEFNLDFIIENWIKDIASGLVNAELKGVISDFTTADVEFSKADLKRLQEYYNSEYNIFGNIRMAQVIDAPAIVFPKIFEKEKNFHSRAFTTLQAAIDWIS